MDIYVPILQLSIEHFLICQLLLIEQALRPYEVNHHLEGQWVAIDEYLVVLAMELVSSREHLLQTASFDLAKGSSMEG